MGDNFGRSWSVSITSGTISLVNDIGVFWGRSIWFPTIFTVAHLLTISMIGNRFVRGHCRPGRPLTKAICI